MHDTLVKEVRSRELVEEKVAYQAQHDGLTGLCNRQHFNTLLDKAIIQAHQYKHVGSVIFIDLNRFKPFNDAMGHIVGDKILLSFANRLRILAGEDIDIGRFGGDEFVILLKNLNVDYADSIRTVIDKINQSLSVPFVVDANSYKLSCSIGYALFPLQSSTVNNLIKFSDIAMYEAKRSRNLEGVQYQPIMFEKIKKRIAYIEDIKQGLLQGDFKLHYQAQFNHYGDVIGAEALLRWQHPEHGVESPSVYIAIAEESDLILSIGQWVIEQACHDIQKLEQLALPEYFKNIAINISAKQLVQHDFQHKIMHAIEHNKISARRLSLELTENLLVENIEDSIKLIAALKANAIDCSIDEFWYRLLLTNLFKTYPSKYIKNRSLFCCQYRAK